MATVVRDKLAFQRVNGIGFVGVTVDVMTMTRNGEFERLFLAHYPKAVAFALRLTGSRELAEDLVQDVFSNVLRDSTAAELRSPSAWLRTAVYRRAQNEYRRTGRERDALARLGEPTSTTMDVELVDPALVSALAELSLQQRAAVLLVDGEDIAIREAAQIMGCSQPTVRVHLHRARARLRQLLEAAASRAALDYGGEQ